MDKSMMEYKGYEGLNLDDLSVDDYADFALFFKSFIDPKKYSDLIDNLSKKSIYTLNQVKSKAQRFLANHIDLSDINYMSLNNVQDLSRKLDNLNSDEFYDTVNSRLKTISPFDIDIYLKDIDIKYSKFVQPILICPSDTTNPNRKIYFSHFEFSDILNDYTVIALVNAVTHTQQEKNIGYTRDIANREIIPIFMELVCAYEMAPETLDTLKACRLDNIASKYLELLYDINVTKESYIYLKSTLMALKLFDMYVSETKQEDKDKILYGVSDVFDGKIQVEDLMDKNGITLKKSMNHDMLKRQFL